MNKTLSREEQIVLEAVDVTDDAQRQAFIVRACQDNVDMRTRVMDQVQQRLVQNSRLDQTADSMGETPVEDIDPIEPGNQIGPYKLLQAIGAGGMGVVYMAEQTEPVRRRVAIKIIRHGLDSKNVIARFDAERKALEMMDHPNITRVYDAGVTESGRPYFVMELIKGMTITKYCDQRQLDLRQRLELFFKVCHAVQHAHQKGVIHRDIKPSNIMVTQINGEAVPKIIDFGIAKAIDQPLTEKTLFTSYGHIVGTPEYMSPEQAEMSGQDLDTLSDIYSLGVVLYELMTGTTPFFRHKGSGLRRICDAICTEEPELASTRITSLSSTANDISVNRQIDVRGLKQFLRGDIDWILDKCLSKSRDDRYATAADLANEIRRYLDGQPILAAAPTTGYRLKKFVSRNWLTVGAGSLIAASMLIGTLVSVGFAARAINAEKLANLRLQETRQAQRAAESERDRALAAEAKLQELERQSRREAANAQAIAKFVNQMATGQGVVVGDPTPEITVTRTATVSPPSTASAPRPLQISVSPKGDMLVKDEGGTFAFEFANPDTGQCVADGQSNCIKYTATGEDQREYAEQMLVLVSEEMRKRFGEKDLFVAEPKMLLANMQLEKKNWAAAEKHLREVKQILQDNVTDEAVKCKNALMLAMTLAKQNKKEEARKIIKQHLHALQHNEDICKALDLAVSEIRDTVDDVKVEFGEEIDEVTEKLAELGDDMAGSIFDSLKSKVESKIETISDPRRSPKSNAP